MENEQNKIAEPPPDAPVPHPSSLNAHPSKAARRRRIFIGMLVGLLVLAGCWIAWKWFYFSGPVPPEVPADVGDPAVADLLEEARQEILRAPRSALAWGKLGMLFHAYLYPKRANICFAEAEKLDPRDRRWPYFQGFNLFQRDPVAAVRYLKRAAQLSRTERVVPHLRVAEALLESGRSDEAEQAFRKVLEMESDNLPAHLGLGSVAVRRGDYQGSLPFLEKAATGPQTRQTAQRFLATAYGRLGRKEKAERAAYLAKHLPKDEIWPDPILRSADQLRIGKHPALGQIDSLHKQGQYRDALRLAEELLRKYPDDVFILHKIIQELFSLGEMDRAKEVIRQAIAKDPNMTKPHLYMGEILFQEALAKEKEGGSGAGKEGFLAAAECFRRAIAIKGDDSAGYLNMARCYRKAGEPARALGALRTSLRIRPDFSEAHTDLAEMLMQQGDDAEALEHLGYAIKLALTDDPKPIHLLALLLAKATARQ
jgi:tetratricopeptide (TPR) repeat protein